MNELEIPMQKRWQREKPKASILLNNKNRQKKEREGNNDQFRRSSHSCIIPFN